ncbi:MAG TPA: ChuX/HutX family heme-like substrate-binding protein [Rhodothermales bacterium]|nr:ChuX/HutX family heme-like substrate-binding protein [Rhodothermales bacterium]
MDNAQTTTHLKDAWTAYRQSNPHIRTRNAADALGVSEAELVATGCGDTVTRLRPDWYDLLLDLEGLGEVMALTRNDGFVHEKIGHYRNAEVIPDHRMGQTLNEDIDLRIFFRHWHFAFAVVNETDGGVKRSLQFFDPQGVAVHKIHLRSTSNVDHFEGLIDTYHHDDQSSSTHVEPPETPKPERPDDTIDQAELREAWGALKDTHDFIFLLRKYKVTRLQAFRLAGKDYAWEVRTSSLRTVLEAAAATELPIMIFVGNHGCIQIHTGLVKKLKEVRGWYNVLDPGFNLHVKEGEITSAWVVRKPTKDGDVHSLEFFDAQGHVLCYLFGKRKEGQTENEDWRALLATLT